MTRILPARGRILIRKPETEESLPGGRIIIPEKSRELYAANQFLIVEIGLPELCDFPEDCSELLHKFITLRECVHPIDPRIVAGAWVVIRPRSLVNAGEGLYLIRQSDCLAVFSQSEGPSESVRLRDSGEAVA